MKRFLKYSLPGFLLLSILIACEKEYESIDVIDDRNVQEYIKQNNLNVQEYQNTKVFYQVVIPGSGTDLKYSDQIPAIVTMRSLDGKFVSQDTFNMGNRYFNYLGYYNPEPLRIGIKEVLKKANGTLRMIVPSRLAFGRNGAGSIPGNASLDVTIKVMETSRIPEYEDFVIKDYLSRNSLTGFTKTAAGIYYKIADPGTGSPITIDSTVSVEYTGKYLNGKVFDKTTAGNPTTLKLSGFIEGWRQIIPLIKQGGNLQMVVPSSLAYGLSGDPNRGMPPFSTLDFTVKVTDVK
ncbi:MAG: FKBP-type peptidyl-prolyl cis-trans isomerase [Pedobacter sp.]|jgi:FKBP-type peptidyl-prolyl cis-trans isomerase